PAAWAQTSAAADAAFAEGVALMKRGQCPEAIDKFSQSNAIEPASGTLLNMAYCQASLGHSTAAWLTYRRVIPLATATKKPGHVPLGREQAEKLETDLPQLVIGLPANAGGVSVRVDGVLLPEELLGAVPVSPGAHRVEALVSGQRVWMRDVTIARNQRLDV